MLCPNYGLAADDKDAKQCLSTKKRPPWLLKLPAVDIKKARQKAGQTTKVHVKLSYWLTTMRFIAVM